MITFSIILSLLIGFSLSLSIVTDYLKKSNDYGNDFGEIYDVFQSSLKIMEERNQI